MRTTLKPLAEQVVLITGASSGIGLVTARTAAARGAKVMLVARNGAALEQITTSIASPWVTRSELREAINSLHSALVISEWQYRSRGSPTENKRIGSGERRSLWRC